MKKYKMYITRSNLVNLKNKIIIIINNINNRLIARQSQNIYIKRMLKNGYKILNIINDTIIIYNNYELQEISIIEK